jgi:hypothetical protein
MKMAAGRGCGYREQSSRTTFNFIRVLLTSVGMQRVANSASATSSRGKAYAEAIFEK